MTYDTAIKLADELKNCEEFKSFKALAEKVKGNETTMSLLKEYHRLQIEVQSMMYTGEHNDEKMERMKKLGELLQMNRDASEYLMAEYRLNTVIGDIYKIIADAVDIDLGMLEA